ncbi:MAG: ABC transporter permease subunit [Chloroflexota bacterium]|nr:ABC transporter permease subunit [Chloroflexota bacterium]
MTAAPPHRQHAAVPPWRNVRVLRVVAQVVAVVIVLLFGLWLFGNLAANMRASGLTFGFRFLDTSAGFRIAETPIPYRPTDPYFRAFLVGLANTLMISVAGIILATVLGVITGVARLSTNWLLNKIAAGYVEIMRNTPLLVQLVLIYAVLLQLPSVGNSITLPGSIYLNQRGLFLPKPETEPGFGPWLVLILVAVLIAFAAGRLGARREAAGLRTYRLGLIGSIALIAIPLIGWFALNPVEFDLPEQQRFNFVGGVSASPELTALLVGLVIYTAAFIGEVVRGGIQSVRRGQLEAAYAVGLTPSQTLRLIVFPQALRVIVPPLTSQYLNLAKNSSLAIAVGFADLFSVGRTISSQTGQAVSVIVLVMATYLAISLSASLLMNIYNRRVQVLEG